MIPIQISTQGTSGAGCKGHVEGQRQDIVEAHYLLLYFNPQTSTFFFAIFSRSVFSFDTPLIM